MSWTEKRDTSVLKVMLANNEARLRMVSIDDQEFLRLSKAIWEIKVELEKRFGMVSEAR